MVALASYIAGSTLFRLSLSRNYGILEFREDLKKLFRMAGVQGRNVVFLLTDSDIVKVNVASCLRCHNSIAVYMCDTWCVLQEEFLEDINCILNSGEVPGLFDNEEMDSIIMELKQLASENGVPDNRIAVFQFFIDVS